MYPQSVEPLELDKQALKQAGDCQCHLLAEERSSLDVLLRACCSGVTLRGRGGSGVLSLLGAGGRCTLGRGGASSLLTLDPRREFFQFVEPPA